MARVLIIEDDPRLADNLDFFISDRGHSCQVVSEAERVVLHPEMVAAFDVVVLDIMMPLPEASGRLAGNEQEETGEIILRQIRERWPAKRVILVTAKDRPQLASEIVFTKPLDQEAIERLLACIGSTPGG